MKLIFGLILAYLHIPIVISLRLCIRKHHVVVNARFLQRVELPSAERCVERCIENMRFCLAAQFSMGKTKSLGMCTLFTATAMQADDSVMPEENLDPVSTVYEIAQKCPSPFSSGDMTHRISRLHRMALEGGDEKIMKDMMAKARQSDSSLPAAAERIGGEEGFTLERADRYATMRSVDSNKVRIHFQESDKDVQIEGKDSKDSPKNPFTAEPAGESRETYDIGPVTGKGRKLPAGIDGEMQAIRPVEVLHQGRRLSVGHSQSLPFSSYQLQGSSAQFSLDSAPCSARAGDPCGPKPACPNNDCYLVPAAAAAPANEWTQWSPFSSCLCGKGERQRIRICSSGRECDGPSKEVESCSPVPNACPTWSEWTEFSGCSIACGRSTERRTRKCLNGLFCPGLAFEDRLCDRGPCPHWGNWSPFSECTKSCGVGETVRKRECIDGESCEGASEERLLCNQHGCPKFTDWTSWSNCDSQCGQESFRLRNRVCLYCGLPSTECEGPAQDQLPCPVVECPTWSEWSAWTDCSTTCGQGRQTRKRKCEGDKSIGCTGPGDEIKFCQIAACPYYSEWSNWSGCSVTCGRGVCTRQRKCITDEFLNLPTLDEIESTAETDAARLKAKARAKVVRSVMSSNGTVESSSKASGASLSDTSAGVCDGPDTDRKVCDAGPCCSFTEWTEWTSCIGCGQDSVSKRNRQCLPDSTAQFKLPTSLFQSDPPRFRSSSLGSSSGSYSIGPSLASPSAALGIGTLAGLQPIVPVNGRRKRQTFSFGLPPQCHCEGESFESRPCPQQTQISCSEDACQWSEWGKWCGCENCRAGKEIRRRYCDKPGSTAGRQGPFQPNAGCSCRGRDTEERECAVDTNCFNSPIYSKAADSYISPKDELARGSSKTKGEGGGSDGHNEYIPIRSKLGEVQLKGDDEGKGEVWFKEKDSPQAFTTTPFPYQMCHWSNWGHFSPCDSQNGVRERKRFCIGSHDPLGNCECHGKSVQQVKCDINDEAGSEENYLKSTDDNKFANALQEFTSESRESNEQKDNDVLEASSPVKECDYLQWSPWSICTKTCGVGLKIRKRRCPCGDNRCGAGKDTDTEECEVVPCEVTKAHPSFALHESDSDHLD